MTKVMWIGFNQEPELPFLVWNEIQFPLNVAVDVIDLHMITKARGNQYFKVIEQEESHGESQTQGEDKKEDKGEDKEKDYRESENRSGYSPVKKKVRKKKPAAQEPTDTTAARVSTPNP